MIMFSMLFPSCFPTDLHGRHMPVPFYTLLSPVSLTDVI